MNISNSGVLKYKLREAYGITVKQQRVKLTFGLGELVRQTDGYYYDISELSI
jgi:hypothetical protein